MNPSLVLAETQSGVETERENIETIEVVNSNPITEIVKSGFKVDILLTEEFKNSNYNLAQILQNSPGIVVRENGGLGSSFELSLNGLSGNQVRYFYDGIPMENFGSSLNFPANLVEQMHIYKGVVPVALGADALGGAVNIITPSLDSDALDLSYTIGSFNTHKAAVFAQKSFDNGAFFRVSSNVEHSDNNYTMDEVPEIDELGNIIGTMSVERFHDEYSAGVVQIKTGVVNKSFADELSLGISYGKNKNNEQHPAKSINQVFGKYFSENETKLISMIYKKEFTDFALSAYLLKGQVEDTINDIYSRDYNWLGEYTDKRDPTEGELGTKSIYTMTDDVTRASLSGRYKLSETENITAQYSYNHLSREGTDSLNPNNSSFSSPNWIKKSVLGIEYGNSELLKDLEFTAFAKQYMYQGQIKAEETVDSITTEVTTNVDLNETGYGTALSYLIFPKLRAKLSYEKAFRLPESGEILGTGKYVLPNDDLQAEESDNINIGVLAEFNSENTFSRFESNYFYRDSTDFIRYVPVRIVYGRYQNLQKVKTNGIEAAYYLSFYDNYSINFNVTYQDIINKSEYNSDGFVDQNYNNRMPNEPYLFGNLKLSAAFELFSLPLNTHWTTNFVEEFFLNWESTGNAADKLYIPSQLTSDLDIEYISDADYSVALSVRNIFDADAYDNFNIEKPGRAFYLKFRYTY